MSIESRIFALPDAGAGPEAPSAPAAASDGERLKNAMVRLALVSTSLQQVASGAPATFETPAAERPQDDPAMLIPEQTQDPAQLRRIKRSPELQAATAQLVEVNARINRFVQFCNTVIVEIRDAPGARDKLKQRSQPCAS